ncbi:hypothetical protein AWE51_19150 [Aquimarina aggregata]|uniref:Uncharacterized protein n=1 Tax=Aquimarina aggregata TaxID=1642818 RepID=A0A162WKP0_9FLAO|nr:hypothetical protein [Aquimarina aggregata]KZS38162.1 hypothetical protein AWE51_19150 [Aquimarina aggregata]
MSDGPLVDNEIQELRQYAIARNGTVKHSELLLMAAMRSTANATLLTAHRRGSFILPMASISQVNRDYIVNFNRESIPNDIHALRFRRLMVRLGISSENITDLNDEIETRIFEEIETAGGRSFHRQAESIVIHLMSGSSVEPLSVLNAMNNASSDSTSGDKVMAGITYIIAKEYNHPLANRLLNGSLKVDALIPRVYRRLQGEGDASYQYSTDQDIGKADTLYLPTNLELAQITDRALIIHELTHAQDDFNTTTATDISTIDLEMNAYRSQSKYVMDEIRNVPSGSAPGWVTSASRLANANLTHYWGFVSAAKRAPSTYNTVLNEILSAAPTSKSLSQIATDIGNSISVIDTNLRNAIINMRDSRGRNLYNSTSTTRVDGGAGHFFN